MCQVQQVPKQSKHWMLTINNPSPEELSKVDMFIQSQECGVRCTETGEEGTFHVHAFIRALGKLRFDTVKKMFPRANIQYCNEPRGAWAYCAKGDNVVANGTPESLRVAGRGRRNDLRRLFEECKDIREAVDKYPELVATHKTGIAYVFAMRANTRGETVKRVLWFWGPTGSGKSRTARDVMRELHDEDWTDACFAGGRFV